MILQSHPVFLGFSFFCWVGMEILSERFSSSDISSSTGWKLNIPRAEKGIPGGFLGDSRRWSGLGRAHWLFLRLQKVVVWVSCVGLCLLLSLWGMNLFEEWVRATTISAEKPVVCTEPFIIHVSSFMFNFRGS